MLYFREIFILNESTKLYYDEFFSLNQYGFGRPEFAKERNLDKGGIKNALTVGLPSSGKYTTELNKIRDESFISIITSDKPIEYFDEFVQKWRKAGGDQLEKEANEWYAKQEK